MKTGRFFVTAVSLFAMAAIVAALAGCGQPSHRPVEGETVSAATKAQDDEAKETLAQAKSVQQGLRTQYNLFIASEPKILRSNRVLHTRDFVNNFDFRSVRLAARRDIQAKLNLFVQLVTRLLEIDRKSNREELQTWLESGQLYLQSFVNFEKTYGENYDPIQDGKPGQKGLEI